MILSEAVHHAGIAGYMPRPKGMTVCAVQFISAIDTPDLLQPPCSLTRVPVPPPFSKA
jgi:hypothetical protein